LFIATRPMLPIQGHARGAATRACPYVAFCAYDLLVHAARDIRAKSLVERKKAMLYVLRRPLPLIFYAEHRRGPLTYDRVPRCSSRHGGQAAGLTVSPQAATRDQLARSRSSSHTGMPR